jgi:putative methionine-R-sulfoxide reductase with GAF domain
MEGRQAERSRLDRTRSAVLVASLLPLLALLGVSGLVVLPVLQGEGEERLGYAIVGGIVVAVLAVVAAFMVERRVVRARLLEASEAEARAERAQGAAGRLGALREAGEIRRHLMDTAKEMTGARRAAVWLRDGGTLRVTQALGLPLDDPSQNVIEVGHGIVGDVAATGVSARNQPLTGRDRERDAALSLRTHSSLIVPLRIHAEVIGALDLRNKRHHGRFDEADQAFVEALARQASVSLEAARFRDEHATFEEVMLGLLQGFVDRHLAWEGHTAAVVRLCDRIARHLQLPAPERSTLRLAALLHDLGLLQVEHPHSGPPGGPPEHAGLGAILLMQTAFWTPAAPLVRFHHERADGTGPLGLRGHEVPLSARILALAEHVDTVTNPASPWVEASETELMDRLDDPTQTGFDRVVVRAWLELEEQSHFGAATIPVTRGAGPEEEPREELDPD